MYKAFERTAVLNSTHTFIGGVTKSVRHDMVKVINGKFMMFVIAHALVRQQSKAVRQFNCIKCGNGNSRVECMLRDHLFDDFGDGHL